MEIVLPEVFSKYFKEDSYTALDFFKMLDEIKKVIKEDRSNMLEESIHQFNLPNFYGVIDYDNADLDRHLNFTVNKLDQVANPSVINLEFKTIKLSDIITISYV